MLNENTGTFTGEKALAMTRPGKVRWEGEWGFAVIVINGKGHHHSFSRFLQELTRTMIQ